MGKTFGVAVFSFDTLQPGQNRKYNTPAAGTIAQLDKRRLGDWQCKPLCAPQHGHARLITGSKFLFCSFSCLQLSPFSEAEKRTCSEKRGSRKTRPCFGEAMPILIGRLEGEKESFQCSSVSRQLRNTWH